MYVHNVYREIFSQPTIVVATVWYVDEYWKIYTTPADTVAPPSHDETGESQERDPESPFEGRGRKKGFRAGAQCCLG